MEISWKEQEEKFKKAVDDDVKDTDEKAKACTMRASYELRNSALNVLRGHRSGRRYKKPHSKSYYTASAPGEPPAVRTGELRRSWRPRPKFERQFNHIAGIESNVPYAGMLDEGTPGGKIKPRPFKNPIIEHAKPKVIEIFKEL